MPQRNISLKSNVKLNYSRAIPRSKLKMSHNLSTNSKEIKDSIAVASFINKESEDDIQSLINGINSASVTERAKSAEALGKIRLIDKRVISILLNSISDCDPIVRWTAIDALRQTGYFTSNMIPHFVKALVDPAGKVRWRAAAALREIGTDDPTVLTALVNALNDDQHWVEWHVTETLKTLFTKDVLLQRLLAELQCNQSANTRAQCANKIGELRFVDRTVSSVLTQVISNDKSIQVRLEAIKTLGEVGSGTSEEFKQLIKRLEDDDTSVCHQAAISLAKLSKHFPEGCLPLIQRLNDPDLTIKIYAAIAVSRLPLYEKECLSILIDALIHHCFDTFIWDAIIEIAKRSHGSMLELRLDLPRQVLRKIILESIAKGVLPTIGIKIWEPGVPIVFPSRIHPYPWKDIGVYHCYSSHQNKLDIQPVFSRKQVCLHSDWFPYVHLISIADLILNQNNPNNFKSSFAIIEGNKSGPDYPEWWPPSTLGRNARSCGPFKTNRIDFLDVFDIGMVQYLTYAGLSAQIPIDQRNLQEGLAALKWNEFIESFSQMLSKYGLHSLAENQWFTDEGWRSLEDTVLDMNEFIGRYQLN